MEGAEGKVVVQGPAGAVRWSEETEDGDIGNRCGELDHPLERQG